ncbi:5'-nucleotidase C-terminal domain-containing protein [Naumannella huperziae]
MHKSGWLRIAASVCAVGLIGGAGASVAQAAPSETPNPQERAAAADCAAPAQLTLLNFNDFHGRIASSRPDTVQFFGTIEELRAEAGEENTIVAAAGDSIGGSLFASASQRDQPTIDAFNAAGVDTAAVGNHEFDKGFDDLTGRVIPAADFSYLGANVYDKGTENPALEEYEIFERAGLRVAVIGAVTQETPDIVVKEGVADLDFGDPVAAVNRVADKLTDGDDANGEADVIVAEIHEGGPDGGGSLAENEQARPAFASLVQDLSPKVQAVFTAHTHQAYVFDGPVPGTDQTRPVTQAGSYAGLVTRVQLNVDPTTGETCSYTAENLELTDTPVDDLVAEYPRVAQVQQIVTDALAEAAEIGEEPIGKAAGALARPGRYDPAEGRYIDDRSGESTITNAVANMFSDELSERTGQTVIGVQNPGGTRADLCAPSGDQNNPCADEAFTITYGQAASILPFANTLMTTTLTGEQFKTMLEQQWSVDEDGNVTGSFLRLGLSDGVSYTYDESRELGDRITSITIDGKPIDPAGEYVVGSGNFLLGGGDNFHVFTETTPVDSGLVDLDAWVSWLRGTEDDPIAPSFVKRGLAVTPTPTELKVGEPTTIRVDQLDFTGGFPVQNTELIATIGDVEVGRAAVADGSVAALTLNLPASVPNGEQQLVLTAPDSGTTVSIPVTVSGGSAVTPTGEPSPTGEPTASPSPTATPGPTGTASPNPGPGDGDGSGPRPPLADTGGPAGLIALIGLGAATAGIAMASRRRG